MFSFSKAWKRHSLSIDCSKAGESEHKRSLRGSPILRCPVDVLIARYNLKKKEHFCYFHITTLRNSLYYYIILNSPVITD